MGIKDLNNFLRKMAPGAIRKAHLKEYAGKRVAIDTSIYFYKFLYKHPRFIEQFLEQVYKLVQSGITPIYIFDGKPPKEKYGELKERKDRKDDMKYKLKSLESELEQLEEKTTEQQTIAGLEGKDVIDEQSTEQMNEHLNEQIEEINKFKLDKLKKQEIKEEMYKLERKLIYVTWQNNQDLKEFLKLLGIPFIQAQCEADSICAELVRRGVVELVMSDDMDLLVDGTQILLRDFHINSYTVTEYNVERILLELNITRNQWIDFCILCGCDYTKRIHGLGPQKAFAFIRKEGSLPNILEKYVGEGKKYSYNGDYNHENARNLFTSCAYFYPEYEIISFERQPDIENNLYDLLMYCSQVTNYGEKTLDIRLQTILNR